MQKISERQQNILDFIIEEVNRRGFPPSVREIGKAVGLNSSSTVHGHLCKLEDLGYIRRDPSKPRAIEILTGDNHQRAKSIDVPVLGRVTAGNPILAVENIEEYYPIPHDFVEHEDVFILTIKGDSMIEAGILDGDYVLVSKQNTANNGDIVVAMLDNNEATVKRFFHEGEHVRLQPENSSMEPFIVKEILILGKVIGVFRKIH